MKVTAETFNFFYEKYLLKPENPILDGSGKVREHAFSDVQWGEVKAIYPMIHAAHSDRITLNKTWYSAKELKGHNDEEDPSESTGLYSFVQPYGKPILKEHRSSDSMWGEVADEPLGRVVYAGYHKYKKNEVNQTLHKKKGYPGTVEGTGYLSLIAMITDEEAMESVLAGEMHTVSIGSYVEKVIESISGVDIAAISRSGDWDDMPAYRKGQVYDIEGKPQLSYWIMQGIRDIETSFVNVPSDDRAKVAIKDVGTSTLRALLGEKKPGATEFSLYDALSGEKCELADMEEFCFDKSAVFEDSLEVGLDTFWAPTGSFKVTEGADAKKTDEEVEAERLEAERVETEKVEKDRVDAEKVEIDRVEAERVEAERIEAERVASEEAETPEDNPEIDAIAVDRLMKRLEKMILSDKEAFKLALEVRVKETNDLVVALSETLKEFSQEENTPEPDEKVNPTYGELYGLEETNELFSIDSGMTRAKYEALDDEVFFGEDRTFPVFNTTSAIVAGRLAEGKDEASVKVLESACWSFGVKCSTENKWSTSLPADSAKPCGPNGTFDCQNAEAIYSSLRTLGTYEGHDKERIRVKIETAAKEQEVSLLVSKEWKEGWDGKLGSVTLFAAVANITDSIEIGGNTFSTTVSVPLSVTRGTDIEQYVLCQVHPVGEDKEEEHKARLTDMLGLSEAAFGESIAAPLFDKEDTSQRPVGLGAEYLVKGFLDTQFGDERDTLAKLVAIARKENLSRQEIDEISKTYDIFGMSSLEQLYGLLPETPPSNDTENVADPETEKQGDSTIQTLENPVDPPVSAARTPEKCEKETKRTESFRPLRVRRASLGAKVPKEKR